MNQEELTKTFMMIFKGHVHAKSYKKSVIFVWLIYMTMSKITITKISFLYLA